MSVPNRTWAKEGPARLAGARGNKAARGNQSARMGRARRWKDEVSEEAMVWRAGLGGVNLRHGKGREGRRSDPE